MLRINDKYEPVSEVVKNFCPALVEDIKLFIAEKYQEKGIPFDEDRIPTEVGTLFENVLIKSNPELAVKVIPEERYKYYMSDDI